jgi:hypothetical protein
MKTAQQLAALLLLFFFTTSCQEEEIISGKTFSNPISFPSPGGSSTLDSDGDGVPDDSDDCPDERADEVVDPDRNGCIDGTTHRASSVSALIRRRPKPCEITGNCQEALSMGEVIISLIKEGVLTNVEVRVYNPVGQWVGSSTKQHGGSVTLKNTTAISEVYISNAKFKSEPLTVIVSIGFLANGKMYKEEGKFIMNPEDFK